MTRGSGSSGGSYRQWAAAERAAQREREQRKKQAEKDRLAAEAAARDEEAVAKTEAVEQRITELESLLRSSLGRDPRIRFDSLKISAAVPPLDLGPLANPVPAPQWADFAPERPTALGRMFGGQLYTKTVSPTHVRDLYGTMQHEGATLGIMITTSGYGPGSVEFANGKPLHLIDGPGLISICQEHHIPARILGLGTRRHRP